jgi:hypothetical protein
VQATHDLYCIRIDGRLGATVLSAFPAMVHHVDGRETVLTGLLEDRAAVFGVIEQVEALGLELIEFRRIRRQRDHQDPAMTTDRADTDTSVYPSPHHRPGIQRT